ncbi:MAG: hypothetical protein CME63_04715 [Halobacteriovoraceae bacterium]|nr:hypothetical protein [Halobacteriovoraceae bacterium]MBC97026.1 hypothetical protein [Halobacteriovoraceae bacterium]
MQESIKNYYEILEVPEDADGDTIHRGYMRAKNAYTQDSLALYSLMSPEECAKTLELIEEAYSILSNINKRKQYDQARGLNNQGVYGSSQAKGSAEDMTMGYNPDKKYDEKRATSGSMFKIMANMRYTLDYKVNADFEKEIEQASDYSGDFLKKIREYKGVEISRMAEMTKISKTYIRYIEDEEFDKLPAAVYVRGFVYQYAKTLKLNPELVANSFLYRLKQATES